ncbi:MAG: 3-deoxy-D-manno-octulosonic acid transferase [Candidatus Omnitrophica bacterium]|nr:3-deoxy-D-manno-octulosonic acid transferase [Candidatus Omnitrophota bacterium]
MYIFYDIVFAFLSFFYLTYLIYKRKYHRDFLQRLGIFPKNFFQKIKGKKVVWIHAVSVGEVNASRFLWKLLRESYADYKIVFSTVTKTGNVLARKFALPDEIVIYAPLDFSFIVRKTFRAIKPSLLVVLETELWPNFIFQSYMLKIPMVLVNARISDKAFRRYRLVKFLLKPILRRISLVLAQSQKDKKRFIDLGVNQEKVSVTGNMKFDDTDYADSKKDYTDLRRKLGIGTKEKLLVAGSTHKGEEKIILAVYKELLLDYPDLRLVLAPRHPERSTEIEKLVIKKRFSSIRLSSLNYQLPVTNYQLTVFILDTVGQLRNYYMIADIVFVGGSLTKKGGHNIIEPAVFSKAVISGKYFFNFLDIFKVFQEKNAVLVCENKKEFKDCIINLLDAPAERERIGLLAKEVVLKARGATARNLEALSKYLDR